MKRHVVLRALVTFSCVCAAALPVAVSGSDPGPTLPPTGSGAGDRAPEPQPAEGRLANDLFEIRYDAGGIRSLTRTRDTYETEYIAAGGTLGSLRVRYRDAPHGDWRLLEELVARPAPDERSIEYALAVRAPGLASRASPSAARGAGALRALNDGLVPAGTPAGGEAIGASASSSQPVPVFTWTAAPNEPGTGGPDSPGPTRWVQYTLPGEEEIARTEVFWTAPPRSWRLLYQADRQWREVRARGPYEISPGRFVRVDFDPIRTMALRLEITMPATGTVGLAEWRLGADPPLVPPPDLSVVQRFTLSDRSLDWTITLANRGERGLEIGDLAVPLDFAERVPPSQDVYTRKLLRHAFVAGHGSWVYWQRANGEGPFLLLLPAGETKFEYFDSSGDRARRRPGVFTPYIHARAASAEARAAGGDWRLPVTSLSLPPGASATYAFSFRWVSDLAETRRALVEGGAFEIAVVPGMVVPRDLPVHLSLRTRNTVRAIEPEHPRETVIAREAAPAADTTIYRLEFSRLGEHRLLVRYDNDRWLSLEFFVTEPTETLIRKRAAFLVRRHQHTDPSKWYVGAYGDWDQKNERRRGPEDRDGLPTWLTDANDDAGNARPAFIASKNVFFPDREEIASLELYISRYLWGGMQMTDRERYPYAIYGIPNWWANRQSADPGRNGRAHVWRIYDYPHIVLLYYRMYQIARRYPRLVEHLDAARYLERAYRTAVAYWTVPLEVERWSADAVGTMNESIVPELIEALEAEGRTDWAETLRRYWEGKVERFVNGTPNLYRSEFAFDSTGFESTGAIARYALLRDTPAFRARVSADAARRFADRQLRLNIADRGWLETTYYQLGSDYRGNMTYLLSYMSQLGGWAILEYALHVAPQPAELLRLGYASILSSWALVNSGTAESGYGYWFPSPGNDGAAGGGFMPEAIGRAWIGKTVRRGAWHYSAEQDVGYCGALRAHATIVTRDPIFGDIAYGGLLEREANAVRVVPRDGLRARFHVVRDGQRLHLTLERDGFAPERPIIVRDDLARVEFALENRTGEAHDTPLAVAGLPPGDYVVSVDGRRVRRIEGRPGVERLSLPLAATAARVVIERVER
ncbi:MAG TPA: DUF5695 domain-containing protein [Vicinamibacterales bacterium]|nr:DUF5695 domain-containing protein [Vicinamibacterales bacterium]